MIAYKLHLCHVSQNKERKFVRKLAVRLLGRRKMRKVDVKNTLPENNACYVLITCGEPSKDGKMQVEMTYQGDPVLAAYLVESAQNFIMTDNS